MLDVDDVTRLKLAKRDESMKNVKIDKPEDEEVKKLAAKVVAL